MRLHLGCGQQYFEGYRNIDFPLTEHTVQTRSVADEHADLTALRFAEGTIDEVRLHHVFEHFSRPVAMGLAACWFSWLKPGGSVRIEVPDFKRTALSVLSPFSFRRRRLVGIRHLFGSHEASWAIHCEGWTDETLSLLLKTIGFRVSKVRRNHYKATYNIEVTAVKKDMSPSRSEIERSIEKLLRNYILDESPTELEMVQVWMREFKKQLDRGWAIETQA